MGTNGELAYILSSCGLIYYSLYSDKNLLSTITVIDSGYVKSRPSLIFQSSTFYEAH